MPIRVPPNIAANQGSICPRSSRRGITAVSPDSSATVIADLMANCQPMVRWASIRNGTFRTKNSMPTGMAVR